MTDWVQDLRTLKRAGDFSLVSLTPKGGGETAHLLTFPKGRQIRVLPDGSTSGRKRSFVLNAVLPSLVALNESSGLSEGMVATWLKGHLVEQGLTWEEVSNEVTPERWIDDWLRTYGVRSEGIAGQLLKDLESEGYALVRKP